MGSADSEKPQNNDRGVGGGEEREGTIFIVHIYKQRESVQNALDTQSLSHKAARGTMAVRTHAITFSQNVSG